MKSNVLKKIKLKDLKKNYRKNMVLIYESMSKKNKREELIDYWDVLGNKYDDWYVCEIINDYYLNKCFHVFIYKEEPNTYYITIILSTISTHIEFANFLIGYIQLAREDNDTYKKHMLNLLYSGIRNIAAGTRQTDSIDKCSTDRYYVCRGIDAVFKNIRATMPKQTTPGKTLKNLEKYANKILENHSKSTRNNFITTAKIDRLMRCLEKKYDFPNIVFQNNAYFTILDVYNTNVAASHLSFWEYDNSISHYFTFYNVESESLPHFLSPEEVFFHEIGHSVHARYLNGLTDEFPEEIISFLEERGLSSCKKVLSKIRSPKEFFADLIAFGLMYGTSYSHYQMKTDVDEKMKKIFSEMVDMMLETIEKNNNDEF